MPATKTKKTHNPVKAAHARSLMFLDAVIDAEAKDSAQALAAVEADRVKLTEAIDAWKAQGSQGPEPRTQDGCSPAQLDERTNWQPTRQREVADIINAAKQDMQAAERTASDEDSYYAAIQAKRSIYRAADLNKIRSREGRTAFDYAFRCRF